MINFILPISTTLSILESGRPIDPMALVELDDIDTPDTELASSEDPAERVRGSIGEGVRRGTAVIIDILIVFNNNLFFLFRFLLL